MTLLRQTANAVNKRTSLSPKCYARLASARARVCVCVSLELSPAFFPVASMCCHSFSFLDKIFKVCALCNSCEWRVVTKQTNSIQYILFISLDKFMSSHKLLCLPFHKLRVAERVTQCEHTVVQAHGRGLSREARVAVEKLNGTLFVKAPHIVGEK